MKKHLLLVLLVFLCYGNLWAQRDTQHCIAPMVDRSATTGQQILYFSTDSVSPFPVTIRNNNVVIGTVTISKGNPGTFTVQRDMIIAAGTYAAILPQIFTVSTKGLYIEGPLPFFVSLRFSITSHAEIITSKGRASIGNQFYAVPSPLTQTGSDRNFTAGILATENNTAVTVSGYSPAVVFGNGTTGAAMPSITFTLNKGESYLIDGYGSNAGNATGFIGAKIDSDKPISVTNGNMVGQFALATSFAGADIIMDQSVPVDRLGDEFILVKGNGNIGQGMEGALVVATEDNTQIFVNGSATAIATINEGEFFRINDVN